MLVYYQIVGSAGWTLLFNEAAGDANESFAPSFKDRVDKPGGYGAPSVPKIPLANTDGSVTFKWSSVYATPDAATLAIAKLRIALKGQSVHLQVINGATIVYLRNAVLTASSHPQNYLTVNHQLTFDTDDITLT